MKRVAIDLTWVRPNQIGGGESCTRNLLDGLASIDTIGWKILLLLAKDNAKSFRKYTGSFSLDICDVNSASKWEQVIWQNMMMGKHLRNRGITLCLEPVYCKPFFGTRGIDFITTIHDLQAYHYPQYFSKGRVAWMRCSWRNAVNTSKRIIAISDYVKADIQQVYPKSKGKLKKIYDAVVIDINEISGTELLTKLGIKNGEYYYTVSSLSPHKNLETIILAIAELKKKGSAALYPLVISGIDGGKRDELDQLIAENDVKEEIIFTSFVSNPERNMLYKCCNMFLFPSIFEGFGMPPLEAAAFGVPVLTTRCTSLEEVTGGMLNYVDDPLKPSSWVEKMEMGIQALDTEKYNALMLKYQKEVIAQQYLDCFQECFKERF